MFCFECLRSSFYLVLLYIFQEKPQESTSENTDQIIERLLNLTGGKIYRFIFKILFFLVLDTFTRANILGELTFDQVETISTSSSSSVEKLLLTHGPDGSIDHDSAVNTVCCFCIICFL